MPLMTRATRYILALFLFVSAAVVMADDHQKHDYRKLKQFFDCKQRDICPLNKVMMN